MLRQYSAPILQPLCSKRKRLIASVPKYTQQNKNAQQTNIIHYMHQ